MFSFLFCLTIILVFVVFKKKYSYWIERGVTQNFAVPLLGINWKILTHQASEKEIFQYSYEKHSQKRYIGDYDFLSPLLIIKDPDLLQQILIKNFEHFLDHRQYIPPDIDPLWNKNVANLKGNKWKEMRSSLTPAFTSNKMRHMFTLMEECSNYFVQYFQLKDEDVIEEEIRETFSKYLNDRP
ncbi:cytochrome P450 9e2-like [Coccinella septempunctata]|uniref:cytochrome P450 9e2-like n=1 Tax=Coccinella septempunctata TaxID=41139 RepID=UPI001D091C28|nr:cytochrome P450 9e2-like [Coccinella septempunctata]